MRSLRLAGCLVCVVLYGTTANAAHTDIVPSLTLKEEFNDNIFFSVTSPTRAFMTVVSPDLDVTSSTETTKLLLNVGVDAFLYQDNRDGKTTAVNHSLRGQARSKPMPRLAIGSSLAYRVSNQPDQAIEQSGVVLNATRRKRQSYAADAQYDLSELVSCTIDYAYIKDDYTDPSLLDTAHHSAGVQLGYDVGRWLMPAHLFVAFHGDKYTNTDGQTQNFTATVGVRRGITERLSVSSQIGGRYTEAAYLASVPDVTAPDGIRRVHEDAYGNGWVGQISAEHVGEVTRANLSFSHDVTVAAGRSTPTEATTLSADMQYRMTADFTVKGAAGYQWDRTSFAELQYGDVRQQTLRFSAGISYAFTKDMSLSASYAHTELADRERGTDVSRNVVFIGLTFKQPLFD